MNKEQFASMVFGHNDSLQIGETVYPLKGVDFHSGKVAILENEELKWIPFGDMDFFTHNEYDKEKDESCISVYESNRNYDAPEVPDYTGVCCPACKNQMSVWSLGFTKPKDGMITFCDYCHASIRWENDQLHLTRDEDIEGLRINDPAGFLEYHNRSVDIKNGNVITLKKG